jgi:pentatricopeptide repeat protein
VKKHHLLSRTNLLSTNLQTPNTNLLSTNLQTPNTNLLSFLSTLKVLRKCRDMDRAEKLLDEMLERGVKLDNVTFSTLSTCAS